jgi:hypothetical protein
MVKRAFLCIAVCALLAACHTAPPPHAIDPAMAACVPPGTALLGGLDLDGLRASPLYSRLPAPVLALEQQFQGAHSLLAASRGNDLLLIAAPGPALTGPPALVAAAQAQRSTGTPGAPDLVAQAESVAAGQQLWLVARGDTILPFTGNAANLNHLLRNMEFAAVTMRVDSNVQFGLTARGRTAEAAAHFENTLRAAITMAAAGETKHPDLAALLRAIRIVREDRTVHTAFSADSGTTRRLLEMLRP